MTTPDPIDAASGPDGSPARTVEDVLGTSGEPATQPAGAVRPETQALLKSDPLADALDAVVNAVADVSEEAMDSLERRYGLNQGGGVPDDDGPVPATPLGPAPVALPKWNLPVHTPAKAKRPTWIGVGIVAGVVALLWSAGLYLSTQVVTTVDLNDPGLGDIAFVISPLLAVVAAVVVGLSIAILDWTGFFDLRNGAAGRGMIAGVIGGPGIYLAVFIVTPWETADVGTIGAVMFLVPVILGSTLTALVTAIRTRQRPASPTKGIEGWRRA